MVSRVVSRIAIASASAMIAGGALALPAQAATPVGPHQFFVGQVFGRTAQNVIKVACVGILPAGHPVAGQSVEVHELLPPAVTTSGNTGNFGTTISADLAFSQGTVTAVTHIATFTSYDVSMPIPTSITLPCFGSGVMSFAPSPNPDNTGQSSNVSVTFQSPPAG
jgi:hypothetical protein